RRNVTEIRFHALRHTAVSLLKSAGVSDAIARDLASHESAEVSRLYTHIDDTAKRSAVKQIAADWLTRRATVIDAGHLSNEIVEPKAREESLFFSATVLTRVSSNECCRHRLQFVHSPHVPSKTPNGFEHTGQPSEAIGNFLASQLGLASRVV